MNYHELQRHCRLNGHPNTVRHLIQNLGFGIIKPEDLSLRDLAEVFIGPSWMELHKISKPVTWGRFATIVQEMVRIKIKEAFTSSAFAVSKLVTKIPGVEAGNPHTTTAGLIISATVDDVQHNRTAKILERADEVGQVLGLAKEKRILDMLIGHEPCLQGNELIDWSNVYMAKMSLVDEAAGRTALVMPANRHPACRIFFESKIQVVESRLAYRRIIATGEPADDAKKWWFLGDFSLAFHYGEAWPLTVVPTALDNGVFLRFKASEQGVAITGANPRYVVKCTG